MNATPCFMFLAVLLFFAKCFVTVALVNHNESISLQSAISVFKCF